MPLLPRFTDAGKALQLRALDGEEIRFTKIQMGSGNLGETSYKTFNALLEPKVTIPITDISVSNGYAAIRGYFNNENLSEGFYYRELGLFAKDPDDDTKEILYCYGNSGEQASFIAEPGSVLIERSIKIIAVVDDAEKISAVINGSAVYVDFTDMKRAIEEHNADSNAHAEMFNQSLMFYIDCNSTEDDELCDGSYEHPFKNISDIEIDNAVPSYIKNLRIVLKNTGDYILNHDIYLGYSELENVEIAYNGNATNKPIIYGSISFGHLKSVTISNVNFSCTNEVWSFYYVKLLFDTCDIVRITNSTAQCNRTDGCGFIESYHSTIFLNNLSILNVSYAVNAYDKSTIHISNCTINTINESVACYDSVVYVYGVNDATYSYNGGIIFTPEIMEKITDGTLIDHINSTANPHHVTLDQAQQEGGMIDVAHGGTGQKNFTAGALLKGNGTDAVGMVTGTGALYSKKNGAPEFGTLPISMGGTGCASIPYGSVLVGGMYGVSPVETVRGAFYGINDIQPPKYGTLPGDCGGTGFSELEDYTLLVGDSGSSVLKKLTLDKGALYNDTNFLRYGILPIGCGGTGTTGLQSSIKSSAVDGARHGHIVIGFGAGPKILICWGRVSPDANSGVTVNFNTRCGNYFKDGNYVLIFSGNDIENQKISSRTATQFVIDSALAARAADWVAIGEVHE